MSDYFHDMNEAALHRAEAAYLDPDNHFGNAEEYEGPEGPEGPDQELEEPTEPNVIHIHDDVRKELRKCARAFTKLDKKVAVEKWTNDEILGATAYVQEIKNIIHRIEQRYIGIQGELFNNTTDL